MAQHRYILEFDELDNPMFLKKVGNWVFTFIDSVAQPDRIKLAMTCVIPKQANNELQTRRVLLEQQDNTQQWNIVEIECFDGALSNELSFTEFGISTQAILQKIVQELERYDVEVQFIIEKS